MIELKAKTTISFKKCVEIIAGSDKNEEDVDRILGIELELRSYIASYLVNRNSLELLQQNAFSKEVKESLLSCYSSMPARLKRELDLYKANVLSGLNKCPYCLISEADTSDHFMPKQKFPEFSFYIYNLIPCCSNCNRRKGERWLNENGRMFFNPYFDSMPAGVLDVEVSLEEPSVNFFIARDRCILSSHIKYLDLIRRYNDQGSNTVSEVVEVLKDYPELTEPDAFAFEMGKEASKSKKRYGENHYEYLIYYNLSQNRDILTRYINNCL
ncbi:MAG: HNH endonuclease signature motif containing protein [Psychrobacter sp.]|uniref:HNH endonuclease n=1 Tax=Cobetia sp. TaxID=1873876 RepID=UPI0032422BA7